MTRSDIAKRSEAAVAAVFPPSVRIRRGHQDGHSVDLEINGEHVHVTWLGEGGLRQARGVIEIQNNRPDVAVARLMSFAARETLSAAGIGWVDETGAAEIVRGSFIISRDGRTQGRPRRPPRWTPAVLAIAEALLCGGRGTVGEMQEITALSAGSATNALRTLTDLGFLYAKARRGPNAARQIANSDRLLDAYAAAAAASIPPVSIAVGVTWRDPLAGLADTGRQWDRAGISWAATGAVAGSVLAPYLTTVATNEVYVAERQAPDSNGWPQTPDCGRSRAEGSPCVRFPRDGQAPGYGEEPLRLVPWPRAYADLRTIGVRGEKAAEHLRETMRGR